MFLVLTVQATAKSELETLEDWKHLPRVNSPFFLDVHQWGVFFGFSSSSHQVFFFFFLNPSDLRKPAS